MPRDSRLEAALSSYEQAVFAGDSGGLGAAERGLDAVEADTALARGRLLHARYLETRDREDPAEIVLFDHAVGAYARVGDLRGEGEARFWIGVVHQVIRGDHATAVPEFERSLALAEEAQDASTRSYALRHLGIAAHAAGDLAGARSRLEESTLLRRDLGFDAGVAANLVGLAYLARDAGRNDDVPAILDEARRLTSRPGAAGVRRWVEQAVDDLAATGR